MQFSWHRFAHLALASAAACTCFNCWVAAAAPLSASRLAVGSSASTSAGRQAIARATATRCCCPTLSSEAGASGRAELAARLVSAAPSSESARVRTRSRTPA